MLITNMKSVFLHQVQIFVHCFSNVNQCYFPFFAKCFFHADFKKEISSHGGSYCLSKLYSQTPLLQSKTFIQSETEVHDKNTKKLSFYRPKE
jgi:hypothetical protein